MNPHLTLATISIIYIYLIGAVMPVYAQSSTQLKKTGTQAKPTQRTSNPVNALTEESLDSDPNVSKKTWYGHAFRGVTKDGKTMWIWQSGGASDTPKNYGCGSKYKFYYIIVDGDSKTKWAKCDTAGTDDAYQFEIHSRQKQDDYK